jgi:parvulin-like peptidyl-prolyl isomerase
MMKRRVTPRFWGACAIALHAASCSPQNQAATQGSAAAPPGDPAAQQPTAAPVSEAVQTSPASRPTFVAPYPRAAWRLAAPSELEGVVLWVSQILIRHVDVRNEVSFNLANWFSVPPPSVLTRDEALALARRIADQAAQAPQTFSTLARQYSEDLRSRDEGGVIGGIEALQLASWPQVLDALAALAPGQSSQVVETRYGFHIFQRSAPVAAEVISGAHIVIGHTQAQWLQGFAREKLPTRSRDEAFALADQVYRLARAEPARFRELVSQYSDHNDAAVGGDVGNWSTREPNAYPGRMRRLQALAVGEVGAPVETHLGFEIVQRTPLRPRLQYRARAAVFTFDPEAPETDASSYTKVLANVDAMARDLAKNPAGFAHLDSGAEQWEDGRGIPALTLLLQGLGPGQVAPSPFQNDSRFFIVQRMEPEPVPSRKLATELPSPAQPDLAYFFGRLSAQETRHFMRSLASQARDELRLPDDSAAQLSVLHALDGRIDDDVAPETRLALIDETIDKARVVLGDENHRLYRSLVDRLATVALLGAPADSPAERGL